MTLTEFLSVDPLSWPAIAACLLCGSIVGLERQLRGKPVGIRTSSLIVLGTYVFIALSQAVTTDATDASRIIGQVVTGVGFLGAGVMLAKDGMVLGVTSAATIWALASIGICVAVASPLVGYSGKLFQHADPRCACPLQCLASAPLIFVAVFSGSHSPTSFLFLSALCYLAPLFCSGVFYDLWF